MSSVSEEWKLGPEVSLLRTENHFNQNSIPISGFLWGTFPEQN